jgi:lipopolysaccharide transport system permease protein
MWPASWRQIGTAPPPLIWRRLRMKPSSQTQVLLPSAQHDTHRLTVTRIEPRVHSVWGLFGEVWNFRELLAILVWRDVTIRYKQTMVGVAWVVFQPLFMMFIFNLFLRGILPADGQPYFLFVFAGLIVWQMFSKALTTVSVSLKENEYIIKKVYFPRIICVLASVASVVIDFLISVAVLLAMMLLYGLHPGWQILLAPVFLLLTLLAAISIGLWLCALDVRYRDMRQALPLLMQAWMFATPVVYAKSLISPSFHNLYALNPMVAIVEGFRWSLLNGATPPSFSTLAISGSAMFVLLIGGLLVFRRIEGNLADWM